MTASPTRGGEPQPIGLSAANLVQGLTGRTLDRKTRALLSRGDSPRSGQPVHRNSYYRGQCEWRIFKRIGDGSRRTGKRLEAIVVKFAKKLESRSRAERRARAENKRNHRRGLLGEVGVEVLEYLWDRVDYMSGRLEPAIQTIAQELERSYSAVHEALCRLRAHGFIQWERRSEPIPDPVPGGPLVRQITSAYALLIPKELRDYVRQLFAPAPAADCVFWDAEARKAHYQQALSSMTASELHRATWDGDRRMGETLARIALLVDERESLLTRETGRSYRSKKE